MAPYISRAMEKLQPIPEGYEESIKDAIKRFELMNLPKFKGRLKVMVRRAGASSILAEEIYCPDRDQKSSQKIFDAFCRLLMQAKNLFGKRNFIFEILNYKNDVLANILLNVSRKALGVVDVYAAIEKSAGAGKMRRVRGQAARMADKYAGAAENELMVFPVRRIKKEEDEQIPVQISGQEPVMVPGKVFELEQTAEKMQMEEQITAGGPEQVTEKMTAQVQNETEQVLTGPGQEPKTTPEIPEQAAKTIPPRPSDKPLLAILRSYQTPVRACAPDSEPVATPVPVEWKETKPDNKAASKKLRPWQRLPGLVVKNPEDVVTGCIDELQEKKTSGDLQTAGLKKSAEAGQAATDPALIPSAPDGKIPLYKPCPNPDEPIDFDSMKFWQRETTPCNIRKVFEACGILTNGDIFRHLETVEPTKQEWEMFIKKIRRMAASSGAKLWSSADGTLYWWLSKKKGWIRPFPGK